MKTIVFRLDCNSITGFGHFYRCLSIAESINKKEYNVYFILNFENKKIKDILNKKKINFFELKKYKKFSNKFEIDDLKKTNYILNKEIKSKINFLFVDHYDLNFYWQKKISKNIDKLIVISDLIRNKIYCDYFVNFFVNKINKKFFEKKTKFISGFENAIIQKKYFKNKLKKTKKNKISFFFGATDSKSLTLKTTERLIKFNDLNLNYYIFLGTNNKDKDKILELIKSYKQIKVYYSKNNNSKFFLKSKFIICTSGYFNLERIFFKTPSSNVYINDNQKSFGKFLLENNLTENNFSISEYLKNLKKILIKTKKISNRNYQENNFEIFSPKIYNVERLLNTLNINSKKLNYRPVTSKYSVFLWNLKNDQITNRFSLSPGKISFTSHKKWFMKNKKKIQILTNNDEPVGQIRLDKNKYEGIIDYAVDRNHRNKGYGLMLVRDCLKKNKKIKYFTAIVHKKNIPSINIFQKLNFKIDTSLVNKNFYLFKKKGQMFEKI